MRAARPAAPRPAGGRIRGDARGRLPGRGDRAAGGDLPVGARRDPEPDQRGDAAAAARRAPGWPWCRSRPSACARTAAGSGSRSARCRSRRSTPPSRACAPRCRDADVARRRRRDWARDRAAPGGVPLRREQARRRADARAGRGTDGARAHQRGRPAHLLSVRAAAHDADAAVHRARSARAALVALSVAARRDRGAVSVPGVRAPPGGRAGRRARDVRARAVAAAHPGVDDRGQRGAVPAAVGVRARTAAGRARQPAAAGPSRSPACSRRWRPSRATTPGWRCRWSRCRR